MPVSCAATLMTNTGASRLAASTVVSSKAGTALATSGSCPAQEILAGVVPVGCLAKRLHSSSRLRSEVLWRFDLHRHQQVALGAVAARCTPALDAERAAVRRTGGHFDSHRGATKSRYGDAGAKCRLVETHRHRQREVVSAAPEHWMRSHVHVHVEVASGTAVLARCALAPQPDALTV